ncbi:MAG: glycosyltransferase [Patescibacteria group bacterium]|nr:glycosyltransferase [Patescibacteria group bacterium]
MFPQSANLPEREKLREARQGNGGRWGVFSSALKRKVAANFFNRGEAVLDLPQLPVYSKEEFWHKGRKFSNYSKLRFSETALCNLSASQKIFISAILATVSVAALADWRLVLEMFIAIIIIVYFLDVLFNVFLVYRSFSKRPELEIFPEEIAAASGREWPGYTVLCPLYKEWEVVPQFISAIKRLDYPVQRLQILLLLEEDDQKTIDEISKLALPENFQTVIVPRSQPKTKPKAMNYGLQFAQGEYIVIYDAEDMPDPLQLKKAVLAFQKSAGRTVCVQAKLNFYNPNQNILTKIFTAEYSLWFDLILPGLQSLDAPIPLGGTSNHFKTAELKLLNGWDAFNVTEDCDLGIRLAKRGLRTAIVNSTTWEEANSKMGNWYRQRSRWIKGYVQTLLVHNRHWKDFTQNNRYRDLLYFQMTVGAKVISVFVNPLMWLTTASYFIFRPVLGPYIESFFPAPLFYMGVFSFVLGNFFYFYHYMIGCAKRGFDGLVKYAFLVPFYWLGISVSAWKAAFELVFKPHYWAKTAHGLHLPGKDKVKAPLSWLSRFLDRAKSLAASQKLISGGGVLLVALVVSNLINFAYSAVLGKFLALEDFGLLVLFNTLGIFLSAFTAALFATVNHRTAYLSAKYNAAAGENFRGYAKKISWLAAALLLIFWLILTSKAMLFFQISDITLGFWFAPAIVFGFLAAVDRGFLQGTTHFVLVGTVVVAEALVKLAAAGILAALGLGSRAALSLPISMGAAFLLTWFFAARAGKRARLANTDSLGKISRRFPKRFFVAAVLTGLSSIAFLNFDVILAKHFLSPAEAGQYALLSMAGKMIFYFGSLLSVFIITFTSRDEGERKDPNPLFYKLLAWTALFVIAAWAALSLLGKFIMPLLFGPKAIGILPDLPAYATAVALFTIANAFVVFHLARKQLLFSIASLSVTLMMGLGVWYYHGSIAAIVRTVFIISGIYLAVVGSLHLLQRNGRFILRNLVDLIDAFFPLPLANSARGRRKILIFNWRDIKHAYAGGAEVYVHELAKRWVAAGDRVTLFCGNDGKNLRSETLDGVQIIRRGGFYLVYWWAFVYYLLQFRGRFDLIIDCQNGIPFFAPLYAKEQVVCLLHHVHQDVFRKYLSPPLALLASVLENRVMPWAYKQTKFITISNSSRENLKNLGLGLAGVEIVNPGVDLSFLRPGRKDAQPLVLYLGRLKAYKSVDVLVKAFREVLARLPLARLVIAGSGEEERRLKSLAENLGLRQKVVFAGKVSEKEKLSLLQRAWVLVNPSLVEGWGITTIEANACGVPVVAANVSGLCDSVKNPHTGFLVAHGDVQGFSRKILLLLNNHDLRNKMGKEAIKWAKEFDWNKISQKGLQILDSPQTPG